FRPDGGEVVAHAAAAAHGLRRFQQRRVDPRAAVHHLGDRVAHRLHEAVDERRLELHAGGRIDAAGGDEAVYLRLQEAALPVRAALFGLDLRERARHAPAHFLDARFVAFGVFLEQRVPADLLRGSGRDNRVHLLEKYTVETGVAAEPAQAPAAVQI